MVTSTIKTFAQKVSWNNLDFIIVDMPPGTGDTQLTFAQEIKLDGAIIVSTPQEIALQDVKRGIRMFDKLGTKIIGLVDNMSFFKGDDGKKYDIFGTGGVWFCHGLALSVVAGWLAGNRVALYSILCVGAVVFYSSGAA